MGLEVNGEDVVTLVDDLTEELIHYWRAVKPSPRKQQTTDEVASDEDEETRENVTSTEIKDMVPDIRVCGEKSPR